MQFLKLSDQIDKFTSESLWQVMFLMGYFFLTLLQDCQAFVLKNLLLS